MFAVNAIFATALEFSHPCKRLAEDIRLQDCVSKDAVYLSSF